jgi:hypothetical protein
VAPIIIIIHSRFHIRCIAMHKRLYFNFSASFCNTLLYYYYHHYHHHCYIEKYFLVSGFPNTCTLHLSTPIIGVSAPLCCISLP